MSGSKHILFHVKDRQGVAHTVQLTVNEQNETGAASIVKATGDAHQQFELTSVKKSKRGDRLDFHARGASVTMSLEFEKSSPQLHVSASLFFSVFSSEYDLDESEYARLMRWIRGLSVGFMDGAA